jgi:hypothetical protein
MTYLTSASRYHGAEDAAEDRTWRPINTGGSPRRYSKILQPVSLQVDVEAAERSRIQAAGASLATVSDARSGWTIGIGGEYAFLD